MMSKSDIVLNIQYKYCKNKKVGVRGWLNYASRKQKADSSSIDEYNMLKDYALFFFHLNSQLIMDLLLKQIIIA